MTQTQQPKRLRLPNTFNQASTDLIREMEDNGWRGRNTVNGHVFMYAPDGETTCSVVPKVDADWRTAKNQLSPYRRWLRQQEEIQRAERRAAKKTEKAAAAAQQPANVIRRPAAEPVDTVAEVLRVAQCAMRMSCDECDRDFATLQALSVHRVRAHVRVTCQFCGEEFSPGNVKRHEDGHRNDGKTADDLRRELLQARQELTRTNVERNEWQTLAEDAERRMLALKASVRVLVAE